MCRADRKSTRLNSSHPSTSYAVFCLKKKKNKVHVKARIERPGHIRKLALVHFLHLLDLGALFFEFRFEPVDNVVDALLFSLRIEDEQGFVTFFHGLSSSILLKLFIAETTPLSIAHFTASTA